MTQQPITKPACSPQWEPRASKKEGGVGSGAMRFAKSPRRKKYRALLQGRVVTWGVALRALQLCRKKRLLFRGGEPFLPLIFRFQTLKITSSGVFLKELVHLILSTGTNRGQWGWFHIAVLKWVIQPFPSQIPCLLLLHFVLVNPQLCKRGNERFWVAYYLTSTLSN